MWVGWWAAKRSPTPLLPAHKVSQNLLQNEPQSQLLWQAWRRDNTHPQTSNSSSSCLTSLIRDVFLSLLVEPKAFSNRPCFFLWISTILSSTESFTINCGSQPEMKTERKQNKTLQSETQTNVHASNVIILRWPSWQKLSSSVPAGGSGRCTAPQRQDSTPGTQMGLFLNFTLFHLSHFPVVVTTKACGF